MSAGFTEGERRSLVIRLARGEERPPCPRCRRRMERREVGPREEVAYVRDRIWLVCGPCGRSAVVDRREIERGSGEGEAGEGP